MTEGKEWKVYFEGNFWGHSSRGHAGKEILLNRQVCWEGEQWLIPAMYRCGRGLVVDLCRQIPLEQLRVFLEKWHLLPETSDADAASHFTPEQLEEIDQENPLSVYIQPRLILNGQVLECARSCGSSWNPCFLENCDPETADILHHYGLDETCAWAFQRVYFPWKTKRAPELNEISLVLSSAPTTVPGARLALQGVGDEQTVTHPIRHTTHTIRVLSYGPETLSNDFLPAGETYPTHCVSMTFTVTPELSDSDFWVCDTEKSDQPERKGSGVRAVSVIGGADGPTAVFMTKPGQPPVHTACSALHFAPVSTVCWRILFREKLHGDLTVSLMEKMP